MSAKPGFDGNPPEFRPARGSQVFDPKTGKVTREAVDSPQNINVDRLEWMLAHNRILPHQHAAGRRLQGDWELAQIVSYGSLSGLPGGSGTVRLADAKCDAISRVNEARRQVGSSGWRILELVVIEGVSVGKAEGRMRLATGNGTGMLICALDALASHYGLA